MAAEQATELKLLEVLTFDDGLLQPDSLNLLPKDVKITMKFIAREVQNYMGHA